jgi:hypothetical protein
VWSGVVSDDGRHVATKEGCGIHAYVLRNSAGQVEHSIEASALTSIWEIANGHTLRAVGFEQDGQLFVVAVLAGPREVEVARRRILVADGTVVDRPREPDGFLPELPCAAARTVQWRVTPFGVIAVCGAFDEGSVWAFRLAEASLELLEAGEVRGGKESGTWWSRHEFGDRSGPCESIYRDEARISQRCGPDVQFPALAPNSSVPSPSPLPSSPAPSSSPSASPSPSSAP